MQRALELAVRGQGAVEPNPMVGCVIVRDGELLASGYHRRFGGLHAERDALANLPAGRDVTGATWYVTLEPCCHHGKTPPCTDALLTAKPARVVIAMRDPFPQVDGGGIERLRSAGVVVEVGLCQQQAWQLNASYLTLVQHGRPWVIAKWAMSLDGKIATHCGDSQWISGEQSRAMVHQLRGRCDAILVGGRTAEVDNPTLTARPPGPRVAARLVLGSAKRIAVDCRLIRTLSDAPVRLFTRSTGTNVERLSRAGLDVVPLKGADSRRFPLQVLQHCGQLRMTNLLVEGGGALLGSLFEAGLIDEYHVFIAAKVIGGQQAPSPLGGTGLQRIRDCPDLVVVSHQRVGEDIFVRARRQMPLGKPYD